MSVAPTLSFDLLLYCVASSLDARDLLNLGATQQFLKQPLTDRAFTVALTVPFDHELKPLAYAVQTGDIQLLSKTVRFLDDLFPEGWGWSQFFAKGVVRLLSLAAGHNLESIQHLVREYPLIPGPLADLQHWELVIEALKRDRYDCASFLLNYQPSLFPKGFPLKANPACYSSPTTLNFLIDHGAFLGAHPLHAIAPLDLRDTQVFDTLVQRGFGVDSPLQTFSHSSMGPVFTPLHEASQCLQPRSVEALLRLGANPNGITGSFFIKKVPLMGSFQYSSPAPLLTILLCSRWDTSARGASGLKDLGRRLIDCFQLLLRYGATTSIPHLLDILILRIWRILYTQTSRDLNFTLPAILPGDINQGVQTFLSVINNLDVSPWDHVCQLFSDHISIPMWSSNAGQTTGKERLIQLLTDYQENFKDLPGPAQLQQQSLLSLPDRYIT